MGRRPVNLDLTTIRFPITAWVSILHRISGFFIFFLIPLLLWMLQESLGSKEQFQLLQNKFREPIVLLILWLFLSAIGYHFVAGIRHLLIDVHLGESKEKARQSAWLTLFISLVFSGLLGCWLW